ncbi:hypothetical protein BGZ98_004560, partial [Dissophora globulifera]
MARQKRSKELLYVQLPAAILIGDGAPFYTDDDFMDIMDTGAVFSMGSPPIFSAIDAVMEQYAVWLTTRYIDRPVTYNMSNRDVVAWLDGFSERKCLAFLRMSRRSFLKLVSMIFDHVAFKTNGRREQEEAVVQLAITLDRLGHDGNGMASTRLGETWERIEGSMYNYTGQAMTALLSLQGRYISWPSAQERRTHSERMAVKGFQGCVGFIDGTTIPLFRRPEQDEDFYYDRNQRYSFNLQVVCNMDRKITFAFSGHS